MRIQLRSSRGSLRGAGTTIIAGLIMVALTGSASWLYLRPPADSPASSGPGRTATLLAREVVDSQWQERPLPYRIRNGIIARATPPGHFPSSISVGHFISPTKRTSTSGKILAPLLYLPDNNMFVTALVLHSLLETERLGAIEIEEPVVLAAIEAVLEHRDRNLPEHTPAFCFYSQMQRDDGSWQQRPVNIFTFAGYVAALAPSAHRAGNWLGIEPANQEVFRAPDIRDLVMHGDPRGFLNRFNMPADSDDTGLALTLGALLERDRGRRPEAYGAWAAATGDIGPVAEALWQYAYKPDSEDPGASVIDPRTYWWMRHWLQSRQVEKPALITTWMQHVYEGPPFDDRRSKMPLNVNNVDPTVATNMLAGLAAAAVSKNGATRARWKDPKISKLVRDTGSLISWVISADVPRTSHDTALLYYPTRGTFYWTAARLLRLLEESSGELPEAFADVAVDLAEAMRGPGTEHILAQARLTKNLAWWPGVLPDDDDRLFATVLMANALIDTWALRDPQPSPVLRWRTSTPEEVRTAVHRATRWSMDTVVSDPYPWLNACFSGSVKGVNTLPFFFPSNTVETHGGQGFHGIRARVPEDEYRSLLESCEARLQHGRLGQRSPDFTHWCSPTLTRAVTALLLAKANRLEHSRETPRGS